MCTYKRLQATKPCTWKWGQEAEVGILPLCGLWFKCRKSGSVPFTCWPISPAPLSYFTNILFHLLSCGFWWSACMYICVLWACCVIKSLFQSPGYFFKKLIAVLFRKEFYTLCFDHILAPFTAFQILSISLYTQLHVLSLFFSPLSFPPSSSLTPIQISRGKLGSGRIRVSIILNKCSRYVWPRNTGIKLRKERATSMRNLTLIHYLMQAEIQLKLTQQPKKQKWIMNLKSLVFFSKTETIPESSVWKGKLGLRTKLERCMFA